MDIKESSTPLDGWILERMVELLGAIFHYIFPSFFGFSNFYSNG